MVLQFFLLGLFCIIQNKKLEGNRKYDLDNVILLSVDMTNKKQHKDNKRERTMVNSMLVSTHLWSSGTNDWLQRKYSSIKNVTTAETLVFHTSSLSSLLKSASASLPSSSTDDCFFCFLFIKLKSLCHCQQNIFLGFHLNAQTTTMTTWIKLLCNQH